MKQSRPEIISTETLQKSYWIVGHLSKFKKNTSIGIIVIEAVILLSALIQFANYGYFAYVRKDRLVDPLVSLARQQIPQIILPDPVVLNFGAVPHGMGEYDLYALIKNQNQGWRTDFDFIFSINGVDQPPQHVLLLPEEQKYIVELEVTTQSEPHIEYHIANAAWQRLTANDSAAIAARNQFEVQNIQLTPEPSSGEVAGTRLTFTLINTSVYKFYDFRIPVILKQDTSVSAIALIPVFSIDKNEHKSLEARWPYAVSATSFEIIPDIDILDPSRVRISL